MAPSAWVDLFVFSALADAANRWQAACRDFDESRVRLALWSDLCALRDHAEARFCYLTDPCGYRCHVCCRKSLRGTRMLGGAFS